MCFNALRRISISQNDLGTDHRLSEINDWISGIDEIVGCQPTPASEDASFRRYFRLHNGVESFIVMDAPPEQQNCKPFIRIAGFLESMQLNAPRVLSCQPLVVKADMSP
jgi:hypothetical protein